ncbi:uncharacterized protein LOC141631638 [Silene latifolia]|uniref:uncharacterized protein LOC141631638 n=1 Tax=Silene latifolia TaxID=37657 RepID=UPI003D784043
MVVTPIQVHPQFIHCEVFHNATCQVFHITFVYARERDGLWTHLLNIKPLVDKWLLLGDSNVIRDITEKIGGTLPDLADIMDFNSYLYQCEVEDINISGCNFTWNNKQNPESRVWTKLDRAMANVQWLTHFPATSANFHEPGVSDHSPVVVIIFEDRCRKSRFSFLNCWLDHSDYDNLVYEAWNVLVYGSSTYKLFAKLKNVRKSLRLMHKEHFTSISIKVQGLKQELKDCQQQAKVPNIIHDDCSSKLFYAKIQERKQQQIIGQIKDRHGTDKIGLENVAAGFVDYYQSLLGASSPVSPLDNDFIQLSPTVSREAADTLILPITNEEIKVVLFTIGSDKSPGPDGFSSALFKHSWPLIGETFCKAVHSFFSTGRMSKQANSTLLALIPKKKASFVKGRSIHENIMLSQSLVKGYGRKYLTPSWIMGCLTSSWFSIKLNGSVHGFFQGKSGVRQGDPLSPYIFVLSMEIQSRYLRCLNSQPQVSLHPKCSKMRLTHLIFADDLMVFIRGDVPSVQAVSQTLNLFSCWSGLQAKVDKTEIYFGGVSSSIKSQILLIYGFSEGTFPFRLQLLNSVVFGIENLWCASVLLPKSVIKTINKLCKNFFWNIKATDKKKMTAKSWSSICAPSNEGGFGVKELLSWNKALISKWLWLLDKTPQGLWRIWHSIYHLSHCSIWDAAVQDRYSESFRSIISVKNDLLSATGSPAAAKTLLHSWCSGDKFQVATAYTWFRPCYPTVPWSKGIFHRVVVPRHSIISSLACQQKLATVDNLILKGLITPNRCVLCKQASETLDSHFQ